MYQIDTKAAPQVIANCTKRKTEIHMKCDAEKTTWISGEGAEAGNPCQLAREAWGDPWYTISARGPKAPEACLHTFRYPLPEFHLSEFHLFFREAIFR